VTVLPLSVASRRILIALLLLGGVVALRARGHPPDEHAAPEPVPRPAPSAPVPAPDTPAPATGIDVTGVVQPVAGHLAEVIVPLPGRVLFEEGFQPAMGRRVRAGQTLAILEQGYILHDAVHLIGERWPLLVEWLTTRRELLWAETSLARIRYQREHHGAPEYLVKQAEGSVELARQAQRRAAAVLRMHDSQINANDPVRQPVLAPIAGVIVDANFTQGQMVYENHKLFTIADLNTVWVELKVPEQHVGVARRIWAREPVPLTSVAFAQERFTGRLLRTSPTVDDRTRTFTFVLSVRNPGERLRVGMLMRASLPAPEDESTETRLTPDVLESADSHAVAHAPAPAPAPAGSR
jgi:multidrug efflux pump subunit AcrA (membrane-fusion protein)